MSTITAVKRIRFGLVFEGVRPKMEEFLKEIGVVEAEGVQKDGKHYVVFTVCKPRRVADVQNAVNAYNRKHENAIRLVPFGDATVTTFERGNKYLSHPVCQAISRTEETYWSWSLVMADQPPGSSAPPSGDQQMINDLESSLTEAPEDMAAPSEAPEATPAAQEVSPEAPAAVPEAPPATPEPPVSEAPPQPCSSKKKQPAKRKRAISELQMNLVESVIMPVASKRSSVEKLGKENGGQVWACCYGLLCIGMFFPPFIAVA